MIQFCDKSGVVAGTSRRESDGALLADVRIARTGIQLYLGSEVDPDNEHGLRDRAVVRVYRPGSEVFSEDTMKSAAHRPVTNDHPPGHMVTSENWKKHSVGNTADEVSAQGIFLRVPLIVSDASAIADIEGGKREVSSGYTSELDFTAGRTPTGESYDAVQKNIRINHIAIVHRGRAGSQVRIGDAAWGATPLDDGEQGDYTMADKPLKTVTVDGLSIEVTDQGAQVIEKLQRQLVDATASSTKVLQDHAAALAAKDTELAKKDGEIAKLKTQIVDGAALDKLVSERTTVISDAARIVPKDKKLKTDGLSNAEIRRGAVALVIGDEALKDKSEVYVDARFDVLLETAKKAPGADKFADASRAGIVVEDGDELENKAAEAFDKRNAELRDGYKTKAA